MNGLPRSQRALLVLVVAVFLAGGVWFFIAEKRQQRDAADANLLAIAQLKTDQIVSWRNNQLGEATELTLSPLFVKSVARWLADPTPEAAADYRIRLNGLRDHYHYRDVILTDAAGNIRLSVSGTRWALSADEAQSIKRALRDRHPVLTDLHEDPGHEGPGLDTVAPLCSPAGDPIGAVILENAATQSLYPLVASWPVSSGSAESLLVRRDGDAVLYLSPLRFQTNAAFRLRIPLTRRDVPAVMAVRGREGLVEGTDYRGEPVLSVIQAIPGSSWFMVVKVDTAEVMSLWRRQAVMIVGLLLGMVVTAAAMAGALWQRRSKWHYQALFKAEAEKRVSEQRYRTTLLSVGDGVIATDSEGRVELLNPVAETLTGWKQDDARGRPIEEVFRIVNERTRQSVENPTRRVMREGTIVGLANHTVLIARDGVERAIADSGAPIRDDKNALSGVVLVFRDVSVEQRQQREHEAALERFRSTLDNMMVGIQIIGFDWRYLYVNPAVLRQTRRSADELLGRTLMDVSPNIRTTRIFTVLQRCMTDRCSEQIDDEYVFSSGLRVWFNLTIQPVPEGILVQSLDTTAQRRAEAERHRLVSAIEQAGEVIVVTDVAGTIQYVNPAFEMSTGYTREEAVGQNPRILKSGEQDKAFYADLWATISGGKTWTGRFVNCRKNGERYFEDANIAPVCDASGAIVNYVAVKRDVSEHLRLHGENVRLEEQLRQSQRLEAVGRLAGGVAHDFNNILQVILSNTGLALEEAGSGTLLHDSLMQIMTAAERSASLTRQLLAFARKQTVRPKVLDLNENLSVILKMIRRLIGENIELAFLPGPDCGSIRIDPTQLDQILTNLVVNARDAISGTGRITIETNRLVVGEPYRASHPEVIPGNYVMLAVQDTGCGMNAETLEHVFEPFFTRKEVGKGTGLGLATVYGIVKQNDGFITVESSLGVGSTFRIHFPRAEQVGEAIPPSEDNGALPLGTETVLLVEDEEAILKQSKRMLARLGYTVLAAGSAAEAIRVSSEHHGQIDLLLTDVVMPKMNGRELAERLSAVKPNLKCLYMSGYTADVIAPDSVLEEGVDFLQKPFMIRDLARKIREVLDRK